MAIEDRVNLNILWDLQVLNLLYQVSSFSLFNIINDHAFWDDQKLVAKRTKPDKQDLFTKVGQCLNTLIWIRNITSFLIMEYAEFLRRWLKVWLDRWLIEQALLDQSYQSIRFDHHLWVKVSSHLIHQLVASFFIIWGISPACVCLLFFWGHEHSCQLRKIRMILEIASHVSQSFRVVLLRCLTIRQTQELLGLEH